MNYVSAGTSKLSSMFGARGGRIFCRTPEEAMMTTVPKPHVINKPQDLKNVGFTDDEIEAIIRNKRD